MKQICYIDDSKTSAYVTLKLLNQNGYMVDHFPDAETALEALMEHDYLLLITDLMLTSESGVNGGDLIHLIRQSGHPIKSRIPIVVVTGTSDVATHDNLIHIGADRVLPKPLDSQLLQKTIEELAPQISESESEVAIKGPELAYDAPDIELPFESDMNTASIDMAGTNIFTEDIVATKNQDISREEIDLTEEYQLDQIVSNQQLSADELLDFTNSIISEPAEAEPDAVVKNKSRPMEKIKTQQPLATEKPVSKPRPKKNKIKRKKIEISPNIPVLTEIYDSETGILQAEKEGIQPDTLTSEEAEGSISHLLDSMAEQGKSRDNKPVEEIKAKPAVKQQKPESIAQRKPEPAPSVEEAPVVEQVEPVVKPQAKSSQASHASREENPLLSLLDHLDDEQVDYDREQLFKKRSIFASKHFKRTFWIIVVVLMLAPAATFWFLNQQQVIVQTTTVFKGSLATEINVPGRVVSKRKINVSARSSGQVTELAVREGDTVSKGQLMVKMDDKEAKSNVNRAQAKLLSIQEKVAAASKMQERLQKALDAGAVSRQRVEDAEAAWKTSSAQQSVIEEELKAAELQLNRLKILAPFDGMITSVTVQEGQWVNQSAPLLNIVDMSQRMAEVHVDVSDSGNLSIGQPVAITSDAFPDENWEESITKISSEASREDSANIIKVFASLDNSPPGLRIGQQLDAQIRTASRSNASQVPFNVLFTHQGRPHVAVIENSQVRFLPVVLGIESVSHVEIIDGLREGQQIIIPSGTPLEEGMAVIVADSTMGLSTSSQ